MSCTLLSPPIPAKGFFHCGYPDTAYFFLIASATLPTSFGPGLSVVSPDLFH
jgi:hypothetical protein